MSKERGKIEEMQLKAIAEVASVSHIKNDLAKDFDQKDHLLKSRR